MKTQQDQTLDYFNSVAKDWSERSAKAADHKVGVIQQRNDFVLSVLERRKNVDTYLDLGCGSGNLVLDAARKCRKSLGIDFSEQMIAEAKTKAKADKVENADFICKSFFDYPFSADQFDIISGNGLIEYISLEELKKMISLAAGSLKKGGELILGSRNRLFNLFSLNEFSLEELKLGTATELMEEAVALAMMKDISEISKIRAVSINQNLSFQPTTTNIAVAQRFQYTPAQLAGLLSAAGLVVSDVTPIHIHVAPPAFKGKHQKDHIMMANWLQNFGQENYSLLFQSSTFMISGRKSN